jgi:hypothetical protein
VALVKCTECGHEISSRALKCPHCGAPAAAPTRTLVAAGLAGVLAAALAAGLMVARGGGGEGGNPAMIGGAAIGIGAVVIGLALVLIVVRLRGGSR